MPDTAHTPQPAPFDGDAADPRDQAPGLDSYVAAKLDAWTAALDDTSGGDPALPGG